MSGIYIHIPFCERKCIYCDFYSVENLNLIDRFTKSLLKEIEIFSIEADFFNDSIFDTIYFGGGTPSLLEPAQIEKILNKLSQSFKISSNPEITLETNPGTVDKRKLLEFKNLGVNRISFGVQSFFDDDLKFLGRIHTGEDAFKCVNDSFEVGFENVSIDLIFGLPGQTVEKWLENLKFAVSLNVPHISAYNLIVERGTPLHELFSLGKVEIPEDEIQAQLYERTIDFLENAGYVHYEVSNYAFEGFECRHNLKYWQYENYIGFGPSAHSFWINKRWWNFANLNKYINALDLGKIPVANFEILDEEKMIEEFIYLGLRSKGINVARFKGKFGFEFVDGDIKDEIEELERAGYITIEDDFIKLTPKGFLLCDEIVLRLISKIKFVMKWES
jgi:oxygen-independent coproporphyrinogen III oxidase